MHGKPSTPLSPIVTDRSETAKPKIPLPRLDGDDLYAWAQMIAEETRLSQFKQSMAVDYLTKRGYVPGEHLLTNDGYIVSRQDAETASKIRSYPAKDGPASQNSAPDSPGSES